MYVLNDQILLHVNQMLLISKDSQAERLQPWTYIAYIDGFFFQWEKYHQKIFTYLHLLAELYQNRNFNVSGFIWTFLTCQTTVDLLVLILSSVFISNWLDYQNAKIV